MQISEIVYELQEDLARSFVNLGLTIGQENQLETLTKRYIGRLADMFDRDDEQQAMLQGLQTRLTVLSKESDAPVRT
jgi:GTP1/Obg family GTP-binding protein